MKRRRKKKGNGSFNVWRSYSDMMCGLLLLFVLIMCVTLFQAQKTYDDSIKERDERIAAQAQVISQQTTLDEQQGQIEDKDQLLAAQKAKLDEQQAKLDEQQSKLDELAAALADKQITLDEQSTQLAAQQSALDEKNQQLLDQQTQIENIIGVKADVISALKEEFTAQNLNVDIDSKTGALMLDSNVMFDYNKAELTEEGMAVLDQVLPVYCQVLMKEEYKDYPYICGIDEVGRGPLAGPVVAGAVILPKDCDILYINDSKKLSAAKREELYDIIMEQAVATGLGTIGPDRIDEINILQATYEAMRQAIAQLSPQPDLLLNDAVTIPKVTMPQVPIIKGDAKSISIGAASIIAKVTRDRMMVYYDSIYPEYGFASNKGYGSAEHIAALKKYGPTPIHRRTFIKNFVS